VQLQSTRKLRRNKTYKPVDELARALPSFKRPLLSVDVMVGMYESIEHYPV